MRKYVVDTNLYVRAFRNAESAAELESFYRNFAPAVHLSSIVLHEILVGARTEKKRREVEEAIARPLRRTNRVLTPTHGAWGTAGIAIASLAEEEHIDLKRVPKSFVHDFLLAASCRESGVVLITDNTPDFDRIHRVLPFEFRAPWPS